MALTAEEIQTLTQAVREAIKPDFDAVRKEMNEQFGSLSQEVGSIKQEVSSVKYEMNERFNNVDVSLNNMAEEVKDILSIVATQDDVKKIDKLAQRMDRVEKHLHL